MAYVPFLMRMNVLNDTAIMERTKKTQDIAMIARGKPSGAISLAVGSSLIGGRDMAQIDQDKERTGERIGEPSMQLMIDALPQLFNMNMFAPPILAGSL